MDGGWPRRPRARTAARLHVRAAVLLEGRSDVAAVNALAERRGRNLAAEGVYVAEFACAIPQARAQLATTVHGGAVKDRDSAGFLGGTPGVHAREESHPEASGAEHRGGVRRGAPG